MSNEQTRSTFGMILRACLAAACLLCFTGCVEVRDPGAGGPQEPGLVSLTATATPTSTFEGGSAQLQAEASHGTPPFQFRWDQNGGPATEILDAASATARVEGLDAPGRYVFRVTVTDAQGLHATDYATVDVSSSVEVEAPDFVVIGEPATLSAAVSDDAQSATFLWEVTEGTATLGTPSEPTTTLTAEESETLKVRLTVAFEGDVQSAATREIEIVAVPDLSPRVGVETTMGDFVIELDGENTPRHMVNFLRYVDEGFYEGILIHRNACTENEETGECEPFVVQGGGYRRVDGEVEEVEPTHDPVDRENETSESNGVLYSVALALLGGNTDSGTSQFYINLDEENAFLDDSGFTVFGNVVEGREVIDAIAASERVPSDIITGEVSQPAVDIVIERMSRAD